MKFTIDRFEGKFALVELENCDIIDISVSLLPEGSKEGDVLKITIDKEETEKRKASVEEKFKRLFED